MNNKPSKGQYIDILVKYYFIKYQYKINMYCVFVYC